MSINVAYYWTGIISFSIILVISLTLLWLFQPQKMTRSSFFWVSVLASIVLSYIIATYIIDPAINKFLVF